MNGQADASYKFGAGRFIMERGLLERAGEEIARYGKRPFIVGGPTAIGIVRPRLDIGLAAAGLTGVYSVHPGHVYHAAAQAKAAEAKNAGCDSCVCVGGGRAMDFGQLVAYYMGVQAVCIPTTMSTCAAYSPFSVAYTPEGQTIPGNFCYDLEHAAILVDLDVMAAQPPRYAVAGLLDSMGKFVEIKNGHPDMPEDSPLSLYAAFLLTRFTFDKLEALIDKVIADLNAKRCSREIEEMAFINIPLTGMISALSRGVGQSAIAHDMYYQARYLFTQDVQQAVHGEIVGLGIIPQLYYNGEAEKCEPFRKFLKHIGAPTCLSEIGFKLENDNFDRLCAAIERGEYVADDPAARRRLREGMELIKM